MIDKSDLDLILGTNGRKITFNELVKMLCTIGDTKAKYGMAAEVTIPAKAYYGSNSKAIKTTLGVLIFNSVVLSHPDVVKAIGFQDRVIDSSAYSDIEKMLTDACIEDRISVEAMHNFLDMSQALGNSLSFLITPTITVKSMTPSAKVEKRKKELLLQHKDKIEAGDPVIASEIEKELLSMYKEELKDDDGMDLYDSGAGASFSNNFKNSMVMNGVIADSASGEFGVTSSNFMEGIKKEELVTFGSKAITGAHAKAINTANGGYLVKKMMSAFQGVVLGPKGSDCKTKGYREVNITKKDKYALLYSYIIDGSKLVLLDSVTYDKYIGKKVKMRTVTMCNAPAGSYCSKCAGERYYMLGITNIGLTVSKAGSAVLNASLKSFHDSTVKIYEADVKKIIKE